MQKRLLYQVGAGHARDKMCHVRNNVGAGHIRDEMGYARNKKGLLCIN